MTPGEEEIGAAVNEALQEPAARASVVAFHAAQARNSVVNMIRRRSCDTDGCGHRRDAHALLDFGCSACDCTAFRLAEEDIR